MVPAIIDGGEGHEDREGRKKATGEALKRALWSPSVAGEAVSLPGWCGTILSGAIRAGGDPFHSEGGQAGVAIPIREPHKAIFFRASPAFEMEPIPTVPSRRPRKMSSFCGCAGHELQHVAYSTVHGLARNRLLRGLALPVNSLPASRAAEVAPNLTVSSDPA